MGGGCSGVWCCMRGYGTLWWCEAEVVVCGNDREGVALSMGWNYQDHPASGLPLACPF